eukprot:1159695-Pelagomonas_calceolata.AAC.8
MVVGPSIYKGLQGVPGVGMAIMQVLADSSTAVNEVRLPCLGMGFLLCNHAAYLSVPQINR